MISPLYVGLDSCAKESRRATKNIQPQGVASREGQATKSETVCFDEHAPKQAATGLPSPVCMPRVEWEA